MRPHEIPPLFEAYVRGLVIVSVQVGAWRVIEIAQDDLVLRVHRDVKLVVETLPCFPYGEARRIYAGYAHGLAMPGELEL